MWLPNSVWWLPGGFQKVEMKARLTKKLVDGIKAEETDKWIWDTELHGFGLRVRVSGRKTYVFEYRPGAGGRAVRKKRFTIGAHGSPWTPDMARKKAFELMGSVVQGEDPAAAHADERKRARLNLEYFVDLYVSNYAKIHQRSWRETERTLNRELVSSLGRKPLDEISKRDIAKIVDEISQRAPVMAHRTFAYTRRLLNWCVEQGYIESNPMLGLKAPPSGKPRERILSDNELVEVWNASMDLPTAWTAIIRLLFLTGQRKSEVVGLRWSEVDQSQWLWSLPGSRTKNGRAHEVPLTDTALEVLSTVPRYCGSEFIFTSSGEKPLAAQSKMKRALDQQISANRMSLDSSAELGHWTIHDIRRTVTTGMARLGVHPHVADALLNHKSGQIGGVAAVYNRYAYLDERREALQLWEAHILSKL